MSDLSKAVEQVLIMDSPTYKQGYRQGRADERRELLEWLVTKLEEYEEHIKETAE